MPDDGAALVDDVDADLGWVPALAARGQTNGDAVIKPSKMRARAPRPPHPAKTPGSRPNALRYPRIKQPGKPQDWDDGRALDERRRQWTWWPLSRAWAGALGGPGGMTVTPGKVRNFICGDDFETSLGRCDGPQWGPVWCGRGREACGCTGIGDTKWQEQNHS
jgi:hypothetical protein